MKNSHQLKVIKDLENRQRRVVLPADNTVNVKKKNFFSREDLGEQKIINISEGGMQILARGEIEVGDTVELFLNFAEFDEWVKVMGKVKWVKPIPREVYYNVGIEFKKIPSVYQAKLSDLANDPLVIEYGGKDLPDRTSKQK